MSKFRPNCRPCQLSKGNPKLRKRIYDSYYNREDSGETVSQIAESAGLTHASLYNHLKKHVNERASTAEALVVTKVEKARAAIRKEFELAVDHDTVVPREDYENAWDYVISEGMRQLKESGKQVSINQLLAATKLKSDLGLKKRGQDAEIVKTFMRAAAGTKKEPSAVEAD